MKNYLEDGEKKGNSEESNGHHRSANPGRAVWLEGGHLLRRRTGLRDGSLAGNSRELNQHPEIQSDHRENLGKIAEKPDKKQRVEVSASEISLLRSGKLGSLLLGSFKIFFFF